MAKIYLTDEEKTLLDQFAQAALPAIFENVDAGSDFADIAADAYSLARAMIQARRGVLNG